MATPRAVVSGIQFTIGFVNMPVDLFSTTLTATKKAASFSLICPDCPEPTKPQQYYICEHSHGKDGKLVKDGGEPYQNGDITRRAKEIDKKLIEVTLEEMEAVKETDVEDKTFALSVFDAADVEAATIPDSLSYKVVPAKDASPAVYKMYHLFMGLASDPTKALLGEISVKKGSAKLARLVVFRGQLLVQTLSRPDDLAPADFIETIELSDKEKAQADLLVSSMVEPFDAEVYANKVRARAEALIEAKLNDPDAVIAHAAPAAKAPASMDDLEALLAASIAAKTAAA